MMGYYQGDWYAGARGDPFFGGLLSLGSKIGGLLSKFRGGGLSSIVKMPGGGGGARQASIDVIRRGGEMVLKHPVLSGAGAAGAIALGARGVHSLRRPGHLLGGARKHRRMNVCNPRALKRSIRRAKGFAKFAMKCIRLTHAHKGRFAGFKGKAGGRAKGYHRKKA
jgi:hypothetical protein